ncbi:hypothetical protein [Mycolicibacterium thermoresistibile]
MHPSPPPPYGPHPSPAPSPPRRSGHIAVYWITGLTILAGIISGGWTMLGGAVASDVCRDCGGAISAAVWLGWGGVVAGFLLVMVGFPSIKWRRAPNWRWPALGLGVVVVTCALSLWWLDQLVSSPSY